MGERSQHFEFHENGEWEFGNTIHLEFFGVDRCCLIFIDNYRWCDWHGEIRYRRSSYRIPGANTIVDIAWIGADRHMESQRWHFNGEIGASNTDQHRQRVILQSHIYRAHDNCMQKYSFLVNAIDQMNSKSFTESAVWNAERFGIGINR